VKTDQYDQLYLLADALRNVIKEYGYSLISAADSKVIRQQNGVLRTNCLDCLLNLLIRDRTNVVQTLIAKEQLTMWLSQVKIVVSEYEKQPLEMAFNNLWADNVIDF
jgi:hypothetical protein